MDPTHIAVPGTRSDAAPNGFSRPDPLGRFPAAAGVLFGVGLGGFFDGIVLHQLLQWHHMLSSRYPPTTIENLRLNTLWDGIFHSATYVFVVVALYLLWRVAQRSHLFWSSRLIVGTALLGWGCFNLIEGVIDHHLLQLHHVNETVPLAQRMVWDLGFLAWGAAMAVGGLALWQSGRRAHRVLQAETALPDVTPAA